MKLHVVGARCNLGYVCLCICVHAPINTCDEVDSDHHLLLIRRRREPVKYQFVPLP